MKQMLFVLSLSTLPMVASADGVGSLYSQISRLCQTDSQKMAIRLHSLLALKIPICWIRASVRPLKSKKTNSNLLDDSTSCIEAVSEQYEQDHPGKLYQ